ncbi:LysE family transporter [Sneathiella chungangensis]|uniref:LysE family transporter n=1 Tax=Sneathiella chungangensis TaxID=1418234 RepID=A0A845MK85_9PROT|nr:LysE family translocator [Sneathiella chungangensis]MZR24338.1 LysE family transporter [Sneathiella chungangensis]
MSITNWTLFILISIAPALSPGPAMLLALHNTVRFGGRATAWSALGNSIGLLILGFAVTFGLGMLLNTAPTVFMLVKWCGAGYLIVLGIRNLIARDPNSPAVTLEARNQIQPRALFIEALVVAVTNPKAILLLSALFLPFLAPNIPMLPQAAIMGFTFSILCYLAHMIIVVLVRLFHRQFLSQRGLKLVQLGTGWAFVVYGLAFLTLVQ